jgi:hypothetical protein
MSITTTGYYNPLYGYHTGPLGKKKGVQVYPFMIIDNHAHKIHTVVVHTFQMGDVEDPDLYAAEPLLAWQNSEMGQWVMERSVEVPMWNRMADPVSFGYMFSITANLKGIDYTFWQMKWGTKP